MTDSLAELDRLQRWMQTVITHPDGVAAGIDSETARKLIEIRSGNIEQVISRSKALDSIQRLHVYGNAYYARLIDCMKGEFPATLAALGDESFGGFVMGYLQSFPSTSYTLGDLGREFPAYLANSRPPREIDGPDWADFLVELATLERVYSDVFDGPGEERITLLSADDLSAIPPDRWGDVRLQTAASLHLRTFQFPVQDYIAAVRKQETATIPQPEETWLAINRRDYIVRRRPLSRLPYQLLLQLQQGETLGDAIEVMLVQADMEVDTNSFASRLQEWFRNWTADGYFVGVTLETDQSETK